MWPARAGQRKKSQDWHRGTSLTSNWPTTVQSPHPTGLVMLSTHWWWTDDTEKPYMFCFFSKPQKERWSCVEDFMSSWIHQRWRRTPFLLLLAAWITRREFVFKKFCSGLPGCDWLNQPRARRLSQGKQRSSQGWWRIIIRYTAGVAVSHSGTSLDPER